MEYGGQPLSPLAGFRRKVSSAHRADNGNAARHEAGGDGSWSRASIGGAASGTLLLLRTLSADVPFFTTVPGPVVFSLVISNARSRLCPMRSSCGLSDGRMAHKALMKLKFSIGALFCGTINGSLVLGPRRP